MIDKLDLQQLNTLKRNVLEFHSRKHAFSSAAFLLWRVFVLLLLYLRGKTWKRQLLTQRVKNYEKIGAGREKEGSIMTKGH